MHCSRVMTPYRDQSFFRGLEQEIVVLKSEQDNRPATPQGGGNTTEFDAFRGQMTRNLNTLQAQIQNLQQQINARP